MNKALELIARRVLPTAVRCTTLEGEAITYRRSLNDIIPGQLLTIDERKRWAFQNRAMVGGPLLHVGFSLRALRFGGIERPQRLEHAEGAWSVVEDISDTRLEEGQYRLRCGDLLAARAILLDFLEERPGHLHAHALAADTLAQLRQVVPAISHATAAIRLFYAAAGTEVEGLDTNAPGTLAVLSALRIRAEVLEHLGRPEAAAADLRRSMRTSPANQDAQARQLARLERKSQPVPPMGPHTCGSC